MSFSRIAQAETPWRDAASASPEAALTWGASGTICHCSLEHSSKTLLHFERNLFDTDEDDPHQKMTVSHLVMYSSGPGTPFFTPAPGSVARPAPRLAHSSLARLAAADVPLMAAGGSSGSDASPDVELAGAVAPGLLRTSRPSNELMLELLRARQPAQRLTAA